MESHQGALGRGGRGQCGEDNEGQSTKPLREVPAHAVTLKDSTTTGEKQTYAYSHNFMYVHTYVLYMH